MLGDKLYGDFLDSGDFLVSNERHVFSIEMPYLSYQLCYHRDAARYGYIKFPLLEEWYLRGYGQFGVKTFEASPGIVILKVPDHLISFSEPELDTVEHTNGNGHLVEVEANDNVKIPPTVVNQVLSVATEQDLLDELDRRWAE